MTVVDDDVWSSCFWCKWLLLKLLSFLLVEYLLLLLQPLSLLRFVPSGAVVVIATMLPLMKTCNTMKLLLMLLSRYCCWSLELLMILVQPLSLVLLSAGDGALASGSMEVIVGASDVLFLLHGGVTIYRCGMVMLLVVVEIA